MVGVETMAFTGTWGCPESSGKELSPPEGGPVAALEEPGKVGSTVGSVEK